jgi:predicted amidohydrolase
MRNTYTSYSYIYFLFFLFLATISLAQRSSSSPIEIKQIRDNFITISNSQHPGNRIGYRFFEHSPLEYGSVPLSESQANIDPEEIEVLIDSIEHIEGLFTYKHEIPKDEAWSKQDWTYHMLPVEDGIEILLMIRTYGEGLPEYYGIQQCFRMGGKTNADWRKEIALTPAFSEYDLWDGQKVKEEKQSLTIILRDNAWSPIPATESTLGARTPLGMAVDYLRSEGKMPTQVGPYSATMQLPIDNGLITRVDKNQKWISGIYWENTSHITDHHPADCIHAIVNIGNIPPYSSRMIRGKIYWFKGSPQDLQQRYQQDFSDQSLNKLTIASCQFPISGNINENASYIQRQMRIAKTKGAEVVHFPEGALSGYGGADFESYEQFEWQTLKANMDSIRSLASDLKLWVLLGSSHELSQGNKPHNSLYVIDPGGKVVDRYDKRFCTSGDLKYYTPGDHFVNFKIKNINCGLLICYDVRFPELYREYRKTNTDIIFQSFYNARHGKDCIHPKIMPVTAQVRAATNSFYMSLTNSSAAYSWPCYFITPDGLVSKKLPANEPGILISTIDITERFYDASSAFRPDAINGKLNSGETISDPKSADRTSY